MGYPDFEPGDNNGEQSNQTTQPSFSPISSSASTTDGLADGPFETSISRKRKRDTETTYSDSDSVSNPLHPVGDYACGWKGCQSRFDQLLQFRNHVRSHTSEASSCLWNGCVRQPEASSSLNKHLDTHVKPHFCTFAGCSHRAAKQRDMRRHMTSHVLSPGSTVYYCPSPSCTHSKGGKPFTRPDNARRHVVKMHAGLLLPLVTETYRE
ncbi:hypothetical protein NA56DRAFT_652254 [Hyaloscypha hepaticicola]|uniref:C2H2-type domain-containing protein n=1 Tax=Hyaloscypha hepaticicola TaxID=2082293 RepID=A0A2J6PF94_9HELO|nr:hypothetical protein NA56DRAFT_652254 [Hyaloscypha hepaticicola]